MMKCEYCGFEQPSGQYCQRCGGSMQSQTPPNQDNLFNKPSDNPFGTPPNSSQSNPFGTPPNPNPNQSNSFGQPPFGAPFNQPNQNNFSANFNPFDPNADQRAISRAEKQAKNAMVMSIIGFFCFGFILGIFAIVQGISSRKVLVKYDRPTSNSTIAVILGIVDIVGWIFTMIYMSEIFAILGL